MAKRGRKPLTTEPTQQVHPYLKSAVLAKLCELYGFDASTGKPRPINYALNNALDEFLQMKSAMAK
jgi:hypothetical protein